MAVVRSPDFLQTLNQRDCACNIDPPASSYAIMRRACPYRGENNGPGKDIHGELGQKLKDKGFQSIEQGADHTVTYLGIHCTRENAKKLKEEELRKTQQWWADAP